MNIIKSVAPARVCLFGDHQDYLELPIIACAINRYITLEAKENETNFFCIDKPDINEKETICIETFETDSKSDYLKSALKVLKKYGCVPTKGYDIIVTGNIAINAGTSSSTALTISWVRFLLETFGCDHKVTPELVSRVTYEAEVLERGSSGGRMDQYSIGLGDIIYLETDEQSLFKKIGNQIEGLIVAESGIPKPTNAVLKELKEKALKSINIVSRIFPEFNLKTAKAEDITKYLECLPKELHNYFEAAIQNHCITQKALLEFSKPLLDTTHIGHLMTEHHQILKEKLDLTVPKIDKMITAALDNGAYGAKIVGSGRGGCIVALAPLDKQELIIEKLKQVGATNAYKVSVDSGARIIN